MSFSEFQAFAVGIVRDDAGNSWIVVRQRDPQAPDRYHVVTIHPDQVPGLQACLDRAYEKTCERFEASPKRKMTREERMRHQPPPDEDLFQ